MCGLPVLEGRRLKAPAALYSCIALLNLRLRLLRRKLSSVSKTVRSFIVELFRLKLLLDEVGSYSLSAHVH